MTRAEADDVAARKTADNGVTDSCVRRCGLAHMVLMYCLMIFFIESPATKLYVSATTLFDFRFRVVVDLHLNVASFRPFRKYRHLLR